MPMNEKKLKEISDVEGMFDELVKEKSTGKHNLPANVTTMKSGEYVNGLVKTIYGVDRFDSASEIERNINEFFADLFDAKTFSFKITNEQGQNNSKVKEIFLKYLTKANFAEVFWQCKVKAGALGRYGVIIGKELLFDGEHTVPMLLPIRIGFVNYVNKKPVKVAVWFDEVPLYSQDESIWFREKTFELKKHKLVVLNKFKSTDKSKNEVPADIKKTSKEETLTYDFLPISILRNDPLEKPRCGRVSQKLKTINSFDEVLSVLPYIEKGGVIVDVSGQPTLASGEFMKSLMLDGTLFVNTNEQNSVAEKVMMYTPTSLMQTLRNTRNDIIKEVRDDLGIPSIDDIKSAQQSQLEVQANMYLSQPTIERERMLVINFLEDMSLKFLNILKDCLLPLKTENDTLAAYDSFKNWNVKVDIELTTDQNTQRVIQEASKNLDTTKAKGDEINE